MSTATRTTLYSRSQPANHMRHTLIVSRSVVRSVLAVVTAATISGACTSRTLLRTTGPLPADSQGAGLRYFVARDVVSVDAVVTNRQTRDWAKIEWTPELDFPRIDDIVPNRTKPNEKPMRDREAKRNQRVNRDQGVKPDRIDDDAWRDPMVPDSAVCKAAPKGITRWQQTTATVSTTAVPDRTHVYELGVEDSHWAAQTLKISVTDEGLLTAINQSQRDQRAEVTGNVLRMVASVAGVALGLDQLGRPFRGIEAVSPVHAIQPTESTGKIPLAHLPLWRSRGERCFEATKPLAATRLFEDRETLEAGLPEAKSQRERRLADADTAKSLSVLQRVRVRDELLDRRVQLLDARLTAVRTLIDAGVKATMQKLHVGSTDVVDTVRVVLDVGDIPAEAYGRMTYAAALTSLNRSELALRLLKDARLLVTVEELAGTSANNDKTNTAAFLPKECNAKPAAGDASERDKCLRIFHRVPVFRALRLYTPSSSDSTAGFQIRESRAVSLASSKDAVSQVALSTKTMGERSLALTFGRRGTITGFEQTSSAGLATATSTLATAITGAQEQFVNGLKTVQTAQATTDAIRAESRAARLKELTDQKAVVDAQLALDGTTATKDLLAQKQQLDAQIALLNAQQTLETAKQGGTVSTDVATMRAELQRLQAELDLLKKQTELEKAQRDLEQARRDGGTQPK